MYFLNNTSLGRSFFFLLSVMFTLNAVCPFKSAQESWLKEDFQSSLICQECCIFHCFRKWTAILTLTAEYEWNINTWLTEYMKVVRFLSGLPVSDNVAFSWIFTFWLGSLVTKKKLETWGLYFSWKFRCFRGRGGEVRRVLYWGMWGKVSSFGWMF